MSPNAPGTASESLGTAESVFFSSRFEAGLNPVGFSFRVEADLNLIRLLACDFFGLGGVLRRRVTGVGCKHEQK